MATFEVYTPVLTKRSSHMGELASFEFVFPDHQGPRVRRELVQALFSAAPDWLKDPCISHWRASGMQHGPYWDTDLAPVWWTVR